MEKKYLLFLLLFPLLSTNLIVAQVTKVKSVISAGGGTSSNASFQNFGVVGEGVFQTNMTLNQSGDTLINNVGFLATDPFPTEESASVDDSLVLVDIYNQTGGDTWSRPWDLETRVSTWYGVTSVAGVVYHLNLADNNLTGILPGTMLNFIRIDEKGFTVDVRENALEFDSAEPFIGKIDIFTYDSQAKVNDLDMLQTT